MVCYTALASRVELLCRSRSEGQAGWRDCLARMHRECDLRKSEFTLLIEKVGVDGT